MNPDLIYFGIFEEDKDNNILWAINDVGISFGWIWIHDVITLISNKSSHCMEEYLYTHDHNI